MCDKYTLKEIRSSGKYKSLSSKVKVNARTKSKMRKEELCSVMVNEQKGMTY